MDPFGPPSLHMPIFRQRLVLKRQQNFLAKFMAREIPRCCSSIIVHVEDTRPTAARPRSHFASRRKLSGTRVYIQDTACLFVGPVILSRFINL